VYQLLTGDVMPIASFAMRLARWREMWGDWRCSTALLALTLARFTALLLHPTRSSIRPIPLSTHGLLGCAIKKPGNIAIITGLLPGLSPDLSCYWQPLWFRSS
jgi:hypothetical protein